MEETSERLAEGSRSGTALWEIHMAAYRWAADHAAGARVLDYGCGTGYGARFLADRAEYVTGYDIDPGAVAHATKKFGGPGVEYISTTPPDASFDLAVSFQVIEHVDPNDHLADLARVLRPGGKLLLTTPNRSVRLWSWQQPWNRWHLTEYDRKSLMRLLSRHFSSVEPWAFSCSPDIEASELKRYRRMRHLLMPATLIPWYPLRFRLLDFAASLFAPHGQKSAGADGSVTIVRDAPDSLCLAAIAFQ